MKPFGASNTPRPGYVYVMEHPQLPGMVKIGRTRKMPHRRAYDLSQTSMPKPFEVKHARFFWDAIGAETRLHQHMVQEGVHKEKEFFKLSLAEAKERLNQAEDLPYERAWHDFSWDPLFHGMDWLEMQWQSAEEDWSQGRKAKALSDMERLSANGWHEASHRLAKILMDKPQELNIEH